MCWLAGGSPSTLITMWVLAQTSCFAQWTLFGISSVGNCSASTDFVEFASTAARSDFGLCSRCGNDHNSTAAVGNRTGEEFVRTFSILRHLASLNGTVDACVAVAPQKVRLEWHVVTSFSTSCIGAHADRSCFGQSQLSLRFNELISEDYHAVGDYWVTVSTFGLRAAAPTERVRCVVERRATCAAPRIHPSNWSPGSAVDGGGSVDLSCLFTQKLCKSQSSPPVSLKRCQDSGKLSEALRSITPPCRRQVIDFLCRYSTATQDKKLCREECFMEKLQSCSPVWQALDSRFGALVNGWPLCARLPFAADEPACQSAVAKQALSSAGSCVNYDGFDMTGTRGGLACQSWQEQCPTAHSFVAEVYPSLRDVGAVCRNPGGLKALPWCFIADADSNATANWDYCSVPGCTPIRSFQSSARSRVASLRKQTAASRKFGAGVAVAVAVVALLVGAVLAACRRRRRLTTATNVATLGSRRLTDSSLTCSTYVSRANSSTLPLGLPLEPNSLYFEMAPSRTPPDKRLNLLRCVSAGCHGRVFAAMLDDELVAAKLCASDSSADRHLRREAAALQRLGPHPRLVSLLAVGLDQTPAHLVLEFMPFGDLAHYLRACSDDQALDLRLPGITYDRDRLSTADLIQMALQIADGVQFIASANYVHRDLAARNCLVGAELRVKIADFGLCVPLSARGVYRDATADALPVRWSPPEVLRWRLFSNASDVWSLGVTLWEVFSMGKQPYFGLADGEVVAHVLAGRRLDTASTRATDRQLNALYACWRHNAADRISITSLSVAVQGVL